MAKFGFDAFLSYSSDDRELAWKIVDWLRVSGFKIWLDVEQIVPGERFRSALEQGLRVSRHLIALLTPSYASRNWTVRELDLFDLDADRTRRRMLGIQVGEIKATKLDQAFRVNQRLFWKVDDFDPEAFWLLYCGLKDQKPGPKAAWQRNGSQLLSAGSAQLVTLAPSPPLPPNSPEPTTTIVEPNLTHSNRSTPEAIQTVNERQTEVGRLNLATAPQVRAAKSPPIRREPTRTQRPEVPAPISATWACVGPTNIGGRATCVVCHPNNPDIVWLGTAGGGVWKSDDAGKSWRYLWHRQDSMNVGALAIDPLQPETLYCGTGEVSLLGASGVGMFRSLNGGDTWSLLASVKKHDLPTRIGTIAVDPFDSNHICLGGVELTEGDFGGMHASSDGGRTWKRESFLSKFSHSCYSIVFHPTRRGVIFATFVEPGFQSGIWRSIDGGRTWKHLLDGLPSADSFRRASLAIAPSEPDVIYASAVDFNGDGGLLGIFASSDMGSHWKSIGGAHFKNEYRMMAANAIVVHPMDHRYVICGGEDLHLTTDSGKSWRQITRWDENRGDQKYAHASHNGLAMPEAAPGHIYDANDGGMDFSDDGGRKWMNRSNGLAIAPYYKIAVAPSDSRCYGGGTDSNGVVVTTTGRPDDHYELLGGSAGALAFDPKDPSHLFASYYNLHIYRWRGSNSRDVSPPASQEEMDSVWSAVLAMDPSDSKTVFTGSYRLWRTKNDGQNWKPISKPFDESSISALEISRADPKRIYVGTEKGGIFRSLNGGDSWSNNIAGASLPRALVSCIRSSPIDEDMILASFAGVGRSHVFRSDDGGMSWIDVDLGTLPDVPHHAIVIPGDKPGTVYVCSDIGVFVSADLGNLWEDVTGNLPNALMLDLVYHEKEGALYVATFGRSIWRMQVR